MDKAYSIAYITTNIAPFRVALLDELAKHFSIVRLYYFIELEEGVNPDYVNKRPKNVELVCLKGKRLIDSFKEIFSNSYVVFDGYNGKQKIPIMVLARILKRKYYISIDGIIEHKVTKWYANAIKSYLLRGSVGILSTNQKTDVIIRKYAPNAKIHRHIFTTLYESDIEYIDTIDKLAIRRKYGITTEKLILFVGKFIKTKGICELCECAQKMPQYSFLFVGGDKQQLLDNAGTIPENVITIKFLEKKDVIDLMVAADIFVLPTYTDVWGLVVVEALTCRVPVITTTMCNAGCELVKDGINGYLVNCMNSDELSAAIDNGLTNDWNELDDYDFKLMGNYTIENAAKKMANFIKA